MDVFSYFQVYEDEPVLQAFRLMRKKRIGGLPVIERGSNKAVGNISLQDIQFLLTAPEIYHNYRFDSISDLMDLILSSCLTPSTIYHFF